MTLRNIGKYRQDTFGHQFDRRRYIAAFPCLGGCSQAYEPSR